MSNLEISRNSATNSKAVVSLVLGILAIVTPYIGLVLGIIGIVFSRMATKEIIKTNEAGSGLAISGLICSIIGVIIQTLIILFMLSFLFLTTAN